MERRSITVTSPKNPLISMRVIPGHFTTSIAHINYYLDVSELKFNASMARETARELALPYLSKTLVDTIVCMEKMEVIGAFLSEELLQAGTAVTNSGGVIHVVTPVSNTNGNLVFQNNAQELIYNKNILLLVSTISSGRTVDSALECLSYYGGHLVGISALFRAFPDKPHHEIRALFTAEDMPVYKTFSPENCEMCRKGNKLDALVNSEGYTKM